MNGPVTIQFPVPAKQLSMNDKTHWGTRHRWVKAWRHTACIETINQVREPIPLPPCFVHVTIPFSRGARRDPHNFFATVKPIVDGLVDAGLWPDDTTEWVTTVEPTLVVDTYPIVTVTLTPR